MDRESQERSTRTLPGDDTRPRAVTDAELLALTSDSRLPVVGLASDDSLAMELMHARLFEPQTGTVKVGRFTVIERLGAGGMGVVYTAYDPELDRKVALKLVLRGAEGGSSPEGQTRLIREAQALAKLSHPNVVAVHEVGMHRDRVWIAMEFVAGQTLGAWAMERPRPWPEVLRVLTDVARGVAAAHEAGLIHRDLKPDNVMIGRDGRVRVMDFGLAHGRTFVASEPGLASTLPTGPGRQPELAALVLRLTEAGTVQGTPGYMAPEQWQGREAEAGADQFGWSVMAWELLYGERPFAGETLMALAAMVLSGQRRPPPRGRNVPGWLRRAVERGLASEPSKRWPTMAALVAALERGRMRARVRLAAVGLVGVAMLAAGAEGYRRWDLAERVAACEATGAAIDTAWNGEAQQRLRDAFVATGVSYAETTADKVMPWLDEQAGAWKQARTDACLNGDVRGLWDNNLLNRAVWCLEEREVELNSLVAEFGQANDTAVQKAVLAVASLGKIADCMDEGLLQRRPVPPTQGHEAIREVRAELARAHSLGLAGDFREALAATTKARERTEKELDWPPLLATAQVQEGHLLGRAGTYEDAERVSTGGYFEAARSGAWEVAANAATDLVAIVGHRRARYAEGRVWAQHAEMAIAHAGDKEGLLESKRLDNLAALLGEAGAYMEARGLSERALKIRERVLGPGHPEMATSLSFQAYLNRLTGESTGARALYERALTIRETTLGQGHPDVGESLSNLALVHSEAGRYAEARALYERGLAILEKALGPDRTEVATSFNNLGLVYFSTGEYAEAKALLKRGLAIQEKALGPDHPDVATTLINLSAMHGATGEYAEARTLLERALTIQEKVLGPDHPRLGGSLGNLAGVHWATGSYAEALALLERALTIEEKALGPDHPNVALSLTNLAGMHLDKKKPRDALPLLERAVTIFNAHDGVQWHEFEAHFTLAEALIANRGDRVRAVAEARKARDGFREAGAGKTERLAEVELWLAEHEAGRRRDGRPD